MTAIQPAPAKERAATGAKRAFSASLAFSGVRCILMYVVLPFLLPLIGVTGVFAAQIDVLINLVAIGALIYSVRRFWAINYRHKVAYSAVALVAGFVMAAFILLDLQELGILNLGL